MVVEIDWAPYMLGAVRGFGVVLFLPLGWDLVALVQRLAVVCALAIGLPVDHGQISAAEVCARFLSGAAVGWPFCFVTDLAASIGELIDSARGVTIAEVLDPLQSNTSSQLSVLGRYAVWVCFLAGGGGGALIELVHAAPLIVRGPLQEGGVSLLSMIASGCGAAFLKVMPVLALFLGCELSIALLTKVSSGISLSTESTILKLVVGTLIAVQVVQGSGDGLLSGIING